MARLTDEQRSNRVAWAMAYQYAAMAGQLTSTGGVDGLGRVCAARLPCAPLDGYTWEYFSVTERMMGLRVDELLDVAFLHDRHGPDVALSQIERYANEALRPSARDWS